MLLILPHYHMFVKFQFLLLSDSRVSRSLPSLISLFLFSIPYLSTLITWPSLFQLVAHHGAEAERHLFRCLFSHVDFSGDGKSSGKDFHQVSVKYI